MLIDDIIRLLWLNGPEWMGGVIVVYTVLSVVAVGCVVKCGIFKHRDKDGLWAAAVVLLTMVIILLLLAFVPTSPLIGVTGHLFPSPWVHGLFAFTCFSMVLTAIVYGLIAGSIRSMGDVLNIICFGIKRWPWTILLAMLVSLVYEFD